MKNVVFVCVDNHLAKLVAKKFSMDAELEFIDVDNELDAKLLNTFDFPLDKANEICESVEHIFLQNLNEKEKIVAYSSNETFISNRDYFKSFMVILIERKSTDTIQVNIQELMKKHAKFIVREESLDIKSLKKEILNNLK